MRFAPLSIFLSLVILLGVMLLQKPAQEVKRLGGSEEHQALPQLSLTPLGNDQADVMHGVRVINFFATWCVPCAAEHAELTALARQFPNIAFHGIVWNDTEDNVRTWLEKRGNPYDALWLDAKGESAIALGVRGVPETFIVDSDTMIRYRISGPVTQTIRERDIVPLLKKLEAQHAR